MKEITKDLPKDSVMLKIPIYEDMKFSLNEIKKHWSYRKKMVDEFHYETQSALDGLPAPPKFEGRVDFLFRYFWKSRILDSTNTAFMSKSVEDAIVRHGVIKTDTNECVRYSIQESVKLTPKEKKELRGDELEVYIMPAE